MLNFLYCLDSNYNQQFLTSFRSVLDNLDEKANFFVIHKNPATLNQLIANVNFEHSNINELKIYKFKEEIKEYPNLENNHISEATYYRFFLDNYINKNIENIIYLDCDIICLNNPKNIIDEFIFKLNTTKTPIAASTEYIKSSETEEVFNRLEMSSNIYFNAGVMIINVNEWRNRNIQKSLVELMIDIFDKVDFWDQDIMNCFFDGNFIELSKYLNFKDTFSQTITKNDETRSIIFLHYAGSNKPWTIPGVITSFASFFHRSYYQVFHKEYLLTNKYRRKALKDLLRVVFSFKILNLDHPFVFIKLALKSLKK